MRFEVYCDENNQDVLTQKKRNHIRFLTIGSLWIPAELRKEAKTKISSIREKHKKFGEIKWHKVSPSGIEFYKELIDLFLSYGKEMRFRCIAVETDKINWNLHDNNKELGFYKFYYQMLHHWILDFNEYAIFCDYKTNTNKKEMKELKSCLSCSNLSSEIVQVQALSSENLVLMQMADLLLGMTAARLNKTTQKGNARDQLIKYLEKRLDVGELCPTPRGEQKFNIFKIDLSGGW